jgi:glycosyltransferase involved in cell wall biosynthesis
MYPDAFFVFNLIHAQRDKYMKRYIQSLKLHKNVQIYSGFSSDDLRTFVASVDVMVAPSLSEGFGFVHAETSCMETSLITTNVASIPEVV